MFWKRKGKPDFLRTSETEKRIYIINGKLMDRDEYYKINSKYYNLPEYSTDPLQYDIPELKSMLYDKEFQKVKDEVHTFPNEEDAYNFVYACWLETVFCIIYKYVNEIWIKDEEKMNTFLVDL